MNHVVVDKDKAIKDNRVKVRAELRGSKRFPSDGRLGGLPTRSSICLARSAHSIVQPPFKIDSSSRPEVESSPSEGQGFLDDDIEMIRLY